MVAALLLEHRDSYRMADPSGMDIIETVIGVTFTGVDAQALFGYLSRTQPNSVHMSTSDGGGGVDGAGFSFALSFGFNGGINLGIANNAYMGLSMHLVIQTVISVHLHSKDKYSFL